MHQKLLHLDDRSLPFNGKCAQWAFNIARMNIPDDDVLGRVSLTLSQLLPDENAPDKVYSLAQKMINELHAFLQTFYIATWYVNLPDVVYPNPDGANTLYFIGRFETKTGNFVHGLEPDAIRLVRDRTNWLRHPNDSTHFYVPIQKSLLGIHPRNWGWMAFPLEGVADPDQFKLALKSIVDVFSDQLTSRHAIESVCRKELLQ